MVAEVSFSSFRFVFSFLMCMYVYVCQCPEIPEEGVGSPGIGDTGSHLMWVLGGKLESSARTARTLSPGAIPPALKLHFLNLHGERKCRPCLSKNRRPISDDLRAHVLMRFPPFSPKIVNISTKHLCNYNRRQIYIEPYRGSYGNKVKNTNIALFMILFCQN